MDWKRILADVEQQVFYKDEYCVLIHGDCKEIIRKLCLPVKVDLILTDPPYEFQPSGGGVFKNDTNMEQIKEAGTYQFAFNDYIPQLLGWMSFDSGKINAYFFCNKALLYRYIKLAQDSSLTYDILILRKQRCRPAHNVHYDPDLEYIVFMKSPNARFIGTLNSKFSSMYSKVYDQDVESENNMHPNQKPQGILRKYISVSTLPGDLIIDPFVGSGQTMLAARELGRYCIGIEKSGKYVEVARTVLSQMSLF